MANNSKISRTRTSSTIKENKKKKSDKSRERKERDLITINGIFS
jgi:hypothetical protein